MSGVSPVKAHSPFRCVGPGVCTGPHQSLDGVEEVGLRHMADAALIHQQQLHQLHGEGHRHVVEPVLHRLRQKQDGGDVTCGINHGSDTPREH